MLTVCAANADEDLARVLNAGADVAADADEDMERVMAAVRGRERVVQRGVLLTQRMHARKRAIQLGRLPRSPARARNNSSTSATRTTHTNAGINY